MRYSAIRKMDVANGKGIRVSIFVQGCEFHCKNCFNSDTWSFSGGKEFNDDIINEVLELGSKDYIAGLSILGGEPLHPTNINGVTLLAKKWKEKYPEKNIWLWTGFLFEDKKNEEIMQYLDVLVDGQYVDELHDFRLKWKGSANQRVIDVKETLLKNEIIITE
ncbi:MAG: anaerobic ribonucleoside-triphosphate reductase activating protein [Erysipelotrichaceae bacterium]|nr:anaerobic ribonucleoside-triphosphate reductase activating protein [Erysipelotrichaceae bacterium]